MDIQPISRVVAAGGAVAVLLLAACNTAAPVVRPEATVRAPVKPVHTPRPSAAPSGGNAATSHLEGLWSLASPAPSPNRGDCIDDGYAISGTAPLMTVTRVSTLQSGQGNVPMQGQTPPPDQSVLPANSASGTLAAGTLVFAWNVPGDPLASEHFVLKPDAQGNRLTGTVTTLPGGQLRPVTWWRHPAAQGACVLYRP